MGFIKEGMEYRKVKVEESAEVVKTLIEDFKQVKDLRAFSICNELR